MTEAIDPACCLDEPSAALNELSGSVIAADFAQVVSYLRATRCRLGLLLNFNVTQIRHGIRRVVLTERGLGWNVE